MKIDWENATDTEATYDCTEVDHPGYSETLCPWIEKLRHCPDNRWIYSIDVPDMMDVDRNGYPRRPRSVACGIVCSRAGAILAVENAIGNLVGGLRPIA